MPKNCCTVGCSDVFRKGSGIQFYRFPVDLERRSKWISAVNRQNWNLRSIPGFVASTLYQGSRAITPLH